MRTREEIERFAEWGPDDTVIDVTAARLGLVLEVLLDIREALAPKVLPPHTVSVHRYDRP